MPIGIVSRAAVRPLAALTLVSSMLGAQAPKCDIPLQSESKLLTASLVFNGVFKPGATPDVKAKALTSTVKALTDNVTGFPVTAQPGRNFLLGQVLLTWLEQPGIGYVEPRAKIGYTAEPTASVDLLLALDSAWTAVRAVKPECADSLKLYTNGIWGQVINKAVTFTNSQQLDSAEYYARRSMMFDAKNYFAYNIMSNIALVKDDTTKMIEWFTKTIDVTAASPDTNAQKVRDNTMLNLAALYSNAAASAEGAKKDSMTRAAVGVYQRYLGYHPTDLTTKLRILRLGGATLDSAAANRFTDTVLMNVASVTDAQLADAGNELTKNKLYAPGLRLFEAALKKNPNNRDALYNSAVAMNNLERFDAIRPYFVKLREVDPNNPGIYSLARNIQASQKLAVQTRANRGVKPRAGQTIMLNPAQQAQIRVFNDSLVYYTNLMQNLVPEVNVQQFSASLDGAKFGAVVQVPTGKPAGSFQIIVDFLNVEGGVVTSQTVRTKQIEPGSYEQISAEAKGAAIVAFKYRVTK